MREFNIEVSRSTAVIRCEGKTVTLEREGRCEYRFRSTWRSRNFQRARQSFDRRAEAEELDAVRALSEWSRIRAELLRHWCVYADGWNVESVGSALFVGSRLTWSTGEPVSGEDVAAWRAWLETEWPGRFCVESAADSERKVVWRCSLEEVLAESNHDPRPLVVITSRVGETSAVERIERVTLRDDVRTARDRLKFVLIQSEGEVPAGGIVSFRSAEGLILFRVSDATNGDALAVALNNAARRV